MTRDGVVVAATSTLLLLAGAALGYPEVVLLGGAGLAAVAVALASLLLHDDLSIDRVVDPVRVVEGDATTIRLIVSTVRRRRTLPVVAEVGLGPARAAVVVPGLARGARWETAMPVPAPTRGRHQVPPLVVSHGDPLRLVHRRRTLGAPAVVWVHPRTCPVDRLPSAGASDLDGTTSPHSAQGGTAFHSLRDYRPGDDPRLIHWASTARTGDLVVRQLVVPDVTHHVIVLNTRLADYLGKAGFEDAVRFAASWCVASARSGCSVTVVTTSGPVADVDPVDGGVPDPGPALDLLAGVGGGGPDDPGLARLPSIAADHRGTALGVVTGRAARSDLDVLASLVGRMASLGVVCLDEAPTREAVARGVLFARGEDLHRAAHAWNEVVRR
jgi:uncharacterized protein (DUF58 family)